MANLIEIDMEILGMKGDKGDKGDTGNDGFSPTVTTEVTSTGTEITFTDKDSTSEVFVRDYDGVISELMTYTIPFLTASDGSIFRMAFSGAGIKSCKWEYQGTTTETLDYTINNPAPSTYVYCHLTLLSFIDVSLNRMTAQKTRLNLHDLNNRVSGGINLNNCTNIVGSLSDMGRVTGTLDLYNCSNVTGSLYDLNGLINKYLNLGNLSNITGNLGCLNGDIQDNLSLANCSKITGAYTLTHNIGISTVNLSGTSQTTPDVDNTLISLAQYATATNGTGRFNARTSASDEAVATLKGKGWSIYCNNVAQ